MDRAWFLTTKQLEILPFPVVSQTKLEIIKATHVHSKTEEAIFWIYKKALMDKI